MTKGYLGQRGVIKLAKELDYSWQEACEVLYRKKVNPKTTLDQILICAQIKYDLELVKAGRFLNNIKDGRIIKPFKREKISSLLLRKFKNHIRVILTNKANFVMGSCIQ